MAIFSIILLTQAYLQTKVFETTLTGWAEPLQIYCKNLLEIPSKHMIFYQAVACGSKIESHDYDVLKVVSLWHIVVVSAGHFQLILWLTRRCLPSRWGLQNIFLLFFCLWTGAQPPVLRAFIDRLFTLGSQKFHLQIPSPYCTLYSGSFCFILFPTWGTSWSLLLSWLCAVALHWLQHRTPIQKALGLSLILFPVLSCFAPPHPLSFLFNYIFGPLLSLILFPVTLLMPAFPFLNRITDPLLSYFLKLLELLVGPRSPQDFTSPTNLQLGLCWAYLGLLQITLLVWKRDKNA